jgi:hypothetical protein
MKITFSVISCVLILAASLPSQTRQTGTYEVCKDTLRSMDHFQREYHQVESKYVIKRGLDTYRAVMSELSYAITQGRVYPHLLSLTRLLLVEDPPASTVERRQYQRSVRAALEKAIQEARDSDMGELMQQFQRAYQQLELRRQRVTDLDCYAVVDRYEKSGSTSAPASIRDDGRVVDPSLQAKVQPYAGTWYAGSKGGCWQLDINVSGLKMSWTTQFHGPFVDSTTGGGIWNGNGFKVNWAGSYNNQGCQSCLVKAGRRAGTTVMTIDSSGQSLSTVSTESADSQVFSAGRQFSGRWTRNSCR